MIRWQVWLVGLTACATTEAVRSEAPVDEPSTVIDAPDAGPDVEVREASTPCAECDLFPAECTPDALCSNGPFEPGTAGKRIEPATPILAIRGRSASDVWAAGALGALAHFDGTSWRGIDTGGRETLRTLWLRSSEEVALASLTRIYARGVDADGGAGPSADGWALHETKLPPGAFEMFMSLKSGWAAPGASSFWCASYDAYAGNGLLRMRLGASSKFELGSGIDPGTCFSLRCGQMTSIHGASANELWAVGMAGAAVRISDAESNAPSAKVFDTQTWNALNAVWMASASDAWAVGAEGTIRHYTGDPEAWEIVEGVPTSEALNGVWGSSPTDVWAVGNAGVVLHYDGTRWSQVKVAGLGGSRPDLTTVWVASPGHLWVGGHGVILSLGGKP